MPDSCEGGKEPSGSTRGGGGFFDQLSYHQLLKKGCASVIKSRLHLKQPVALTDCYLKLSVHAEYQCYHACLHIPLAKYCLIAL